MAALTERKIGFIGAGNMAMAMLKSLAAQGGAGENVIVGRKSRERLDEIRTMGFSATDDNAEVVKASDFIVIAVKPQMLAEALEGLSEAAAGKCFLSIAAGVTTATLKGYLGDVCILRAMPNTPMTVGAGASGLYIPDDASAVDRETALSLLSLGGLVRVVDEGQIDLVTALSGSGPAYFYRIAEVMASFAEERGMDAETASLLVVQTMEGAAKMLRSGGKTPSELIRAVASPGGTTLAALSAFDREGLDAALRAGLEACVKRAEELSRP